VLSFLKKTGRDALSGEAARARRDAFSVAFAWTFVIFYNFVGVADILSTAYAIGIGVAEEANPMMRAAMDHFGMGWIGAKITLQVLICAMVLWFPHRIVLAMFATAVCGNALVVVNNLHIAGLL
jgi:hypothetical protein